MARLTDHDLRDAEDALRKEISLIVGRYTRRMLEHGKAYIQTELESLESEEAIDGTIIGRAAAKSAAFPYFGGAAPQQAIEGVAHRSLQT